ncbi:ABC-2 transporter permease [Paenibacillaceae bacterium WGS1546]|uniref:ABC-2 transporter permease n=1 Tax=Cohnella sp. WGS1546 TaxID=3366810 RepID=UPI00372CECBF
MVKLIRKDLLALKMYFLFVVAYAAIFGIFAVSPFSSVLIAVLPPIMMTVFAASLESRNKSMLFVGSLPVRRQQIVAAKYASVLVYLVMGVALVGVVYAVNVYALERDFPITDMRLSLSAAIALSFAAVYYPVQFWLGVRYSSFVTFLVIFLTAALIGGLGGAADSLEADWPSRTGLLAGLPFAGLVLLYLSYRASLAIFLRKDMEG